MQLQAVDLFLPANVAEAGYHQHNHQANQPPEQDRIQPERQVDPLKVLQGLGHRIE